MISANIRNARRLVLAYYVAVEAVKELPEGLRTDAMGELLEEGYKDKLLYKTKGNQEISAKSLQSAYDEDATYRKKAKKLGKGYVVT